MHTRILLSVGAATLLTLSATEALAHHAGGIGNSGSGGPINTISAETLEAQHGVASVSVTYGDFSHLSDETLTNATASGNEGVHSLGTIQSYALSYAYGFNNDLMLGFRLPYLKRTDIREAEDDGAGGFEIDDHGEPKGIGDLSLFAQYRFFKNNETQAALIFGLKTPTGSTSERSPKGELQDAEFQPGSGSWDPTFGIALTRHYGHWSFDANALYNVATEGTQSTDLGDQFLYNFAITYRLSSNSGQGPSFHGGHDHRDAEAGARGNNAGSSGPVLDLVIELNGEWHDKQKEGGTVDENSGGNTIYIAPGLRLSQGNVSGYASIGIPVVTDENGVQPEADWRLTTGVSILFHRSRPRPLVTAD